jgi:aminopeptidase N
MRQPIPPYLFAFAVGNLASRELGPRSRVWAEPELLDDAAYEFAGVEEMLAAAEHLFGPYDWERFDLLTMPPSFPYGGMENPSLTFLTPTLIAKDRSLVNVVAHELAHSWTGNLVSNASAEDFWLNEGFTVFAERHLLEALFGHELCQLHAALGRRSVDEAVLQFAERPELTKLKTRLWGVDPDEAYSLVPYEKGYLFLAALQGAVGRERMLAFLKSYAKRFRFQSITTEDFLSFTRAELQGALEQVGYEAWVDGVGIPKNAPTVHSSRLEAIKALGQGLPSEAQAQAWAPVEWQVYLSSLSAPQPAQRCGALDQRFGLTNSSNYEILVDWLALAVRSGYAPGVERTKGVLGEVGRMKYLKPLYLALLSREETRAVARGCFERFRGSYHPIAVHVVGKLLASS